MLIMRVHAGHLRSQERLLERFNKEYEKLEEISDRDYTKEVFLLAVPDRTPLNILVDHHGLYALP